MDDGVDAEEQAKWLDSVGSGESGAMPHTSSLFFCHPPPIPRDERTAHCCGRSISYVEDRTEVTVGTFVHQRPHTPWE